MRKATSRISILLAAMLAFGNILPIAAGAQTAPAAKTKAARYTIKMVYPYIYAKPNDLTKVEAAVNKEIKNKINASVSFIPISYATLNNQQMLSIASGEQMDLVYTFNNFSNMVSKNQLKPLDGLVNKYGPDIKAQLGSMLSTGKLKGKLYAIANVKDWGDGGAFVFVKSILDKYKIDPSKIKTFLDVEKVFAKVKKGEPNMTMLASYGSMYGLADYFAKYDKLNDGLGVLMNGGTQNLKVVNYYESKEYRNLCVTFRRWYNKGYILPDVSTTTDLGETLMASGKVFATDTNYKPGIEVDARNAVGKDVSIVKITDAYRTSSSIGGAASWGIGSTSKKPEIAMQFLNLMYKDAALVNLLDNGIQGVHYKKVASNVIDFPNGVNSRNSGYYPSLTFQFGDEFLSYLWKGTDTKLWSKMKTYNNSLQISKACGFNFDASSVKSQESACQNVVQKYTVALGDGEVDVDSTLAKLNGELKANGIETIIKAKQNQLNKWAKSK